MPVLSLHLPTCSDSNPVTVLSRGSASSVSFRRWNDPTPTALQVLSGVEELELLPAPARRWLNRRLRLGERTLRMRLDWVAARGPWSPVPGTTAAWTAEQVGPEGIAASDHAPIGVVATRSESG